MRRTDSGSKFPSPCYDAAGPECDVVCKPVNPEQTKRALDLFKVALSLEGGERARLLDEACGKDDELRGEVEGMLREEERLEPLLGAVPADRARLVVNAVAADLPLPSRLGQYAISRLLGEGGMGLVYEAVQAAPHRRVALKVLRPGALSTEHRRRFEQEVEALGRLRHPGIAQIFEGGTLPMESGPHPFLAMELVDGLNILEHADRKELSVSQRFELLARVADAVQHAHERGVVHRDLKPENILVDGTGQPKILDFGVAHFTDHEMRKTLTRSGELVGTIAFMSPEQLLGDPAAVTAASDVYALGVLAYELLAGRLPIALDGHPFPEAIRLAQVSEPELLGALDPQLRGDPEAIVAKALEKDVSRRYRSAGDLSDDIRKALRHEPIQARRPTVLYQLRKFTRRHRGVVAAGGSCVAVAVRGAGSRGQVQ